MSADPRVTGWFAAEFGGKRDLAAINEDEITSRVFGTVLSLAPSEIREFFTSLGIETPQGPSVSELWPALSTCEPDVLMSWGSTLKMLVECKWNAPADETQLSEEARSVAVGPAVLLFITRDLVPPVQFERARMGDTAGVRWTWRDWSSLYKALRTCYPGSSAPFQIRCLMHYMEKLDMSPWTEDMAYFETVDQDGVRRAVAGLKTFFTQLGEGLKAQYGKIESSFADQLQPYIGYPHSSLRGFPGELYVYISYRTESPHWEVSVEAGTKKGQSAWVQALQSMSIPQAEVNRATGSYWIASRFVSLERGLSPEKMRSALIQAADLLAEQVGAKLKDAKPAE